MDNIYDTLAKLNKVANTPKVIKEDSNGMMSKGLEKMIQTSKMNKQKNYTPFSDKQSPDGLPEKKKDNKMFEKESDVERDDRAEKAGREVAHDAKYDHRDHAGKDGKDVTGDIEYDEKHDKDGMHEASKTMVKGPDGKMVPDYAVDGEGKDDMKEGGSLKDAARAGVMARLAELAGLPAKEIEEALGDSPQDTASRIMSEVSLDEEELDEGTDRITDPEELNLYSDEEIKAAKSTSAEELKDELLTNIGYLMDQSKDPDDGEGQVNDYIADHMGGFYANMHLMADDATLSCYETMRDMLNADPDALYQAGKKCLKILGAEASVEEGAVEEASVEVPVQELQDILQLAGYENYAEKIEEYANEPDEEYGDAQEQMVGLSGGLNGPKTHYPAAAGGDNPMAVKALKVTDDVYEGFYSKYDKFVKEFNEENK